MLYIKKFIEKATITETRSRKDLVLSIEEVRGLKDDIMNLLADLYEKKQVTPDTVTVELRGGTFKDE